MALSIKDREAEHLARELAKQKGESLTDAIVKALHERLQRVTGRHRPIGLADQLDDIAKRCAALPVIDERSEDEILGYDEKGLPH
jgi:antitoxin VapB